MTYENLIIVVPLMFREVFVLTKLMPNTLTVPPHTGRRWLKGLEIVFVQAPDDWTSKHPQVSHVYENPLSLVPRKDPGLTTASPLIHSCFSLRSRNPALRF